MGLFSFVKFLLLLFALANLALLLNGNELYKKHPRVARGQMLSLLRHRWS